jgi:hypothetical protein
LGGSIPRIGAKLIDMDIKEKVAKMVEGFKKLPFSVEGLVNQLDLEVLTFMEAACIGLEAKTKAEETVITSVYVKAIVLDDLRMIQRNLDTIRGAIKLKELQFGSMCLN